MLKRSGLCFLVVLFALSQTSHADSITGASSGGLPSGGAPGQELVNTGPGVAVWAFPTSLASPGGPDFRHAFAWSALPGSTELTAALLVQVLVKYNGGSPATFTAVALSDRDGSQPSNTNGGNSGFYTGSISVTRATLAPILTVVAQTPASLATSAHYVSLVGGGSGIGTTAPLSPSTSAAFATAPFARIIYASAVSANWLLETGDGTTRSCTDTGLVAVTGANMTFVIDMTTAGKVVSRIYVGGLATTPTVTSKTTNVPTSNATMIADTGINNTSGGSLVNGMIYTGLRVETN